MSDYDAEERLGFVCDELRDLYEQIDASAGDMTIEDIQTRIVEILDAAAEGWDG